MIMQNLKEIRFVSTNYSNLQGLRPVPMGLYLIVVCFWANMVKYPVRGAAYLVPALGGIVAILLMMWLDRYYLRTFGRVQRTAESRRLEWLIGAVFGVLAVAAFWLDNTRDLPVSLVGLTFAVGLLADYIRITWLVKGRYLLYYPLGALLMAGVSILPLLGAQNWWQVIGLCTQMIGIAMLIGLFVCIAGVWGHVYLVRTLNPRGDQNVNTL